jgi:hypothetical protein
MLPLHKGVKAGDPSVGRGIQFAGSTKAVAGTEMTVYLLVTTLRSADTATNL